MKSLSASWNETIQKMNQQSAVVDLQAENARLKEDRENFRIAQEKAVIALDDEHAKVVRLTRHVRELEAWKSQAEGLLRQVEFESKIIHNAQFCDNFTDAANARVRFNALWKERIPAFLHPEQEKEKKT